MVFSGLRSLTEEAVGYTCLVLEAVTLPGARPEHLPFPLTLLPVRPRRPVDLKANPPDAAGCPPIAPG